MKIKLISALAFTLCLSSCIKDEPLFREADIVSFKIDDDSFISSTINDNEIQIIVSEGASYKKIVPKIELSTGATVMPALGDTVDFTNDVIYKVISEDGNYSKEYIIKIKSKINMIYDFEDWTLAGVSWKYPALEDITWSSANQGIMLAKLGIVDLYPTRDTTLAVEGNYAALLETQVGGTYWGNKIPIFSGSLFRGKFALNMADFVKSAKFGQIHLEEDRRPTLFTGYYKYSPGKHFVSSTGDTIPGRIDECSIHAVLFKVTKGKDGENEYLDGTNILTSNNIIAKAVLGDSSAKEEFTKFSIPFVYREDEGIDYKLHDYKLAIVFASSKRGDYYEGAIGSQLIVDKVEIECEGYKK